MAFEYKSKSDETLVELTFKGDSNAYYHLVKRYQEKLLRYTTTILHNTDNAEDVVQNTFIKAYRNLHQFNHKLKFSSWIYRIAHNETINYIKKNKKHQTLNTPELLKNQPDLSISKLDEIISIENKSELLRYIDMLPLKYKEVISLYYMEDKSYAEISDILRIPKSTVGTYLLRAKQQLKDLIMDKEE